MVEMAQFVSTGMSATLPGPVEICPTTLEDFAPRFRRAFDIHSRGARTASA